MISSRDHTHTHTHTQHEFLSLNETHEWNTVKEKCFIKKIIVITLLPFYLFLPLTVSVYCLYALLLFIFLFISFSSIIIFYHFPAKLLFWRSICATSPIISIQMLVICPMIFFFYLFKLLEHLMFIFSISFSFSPP